MKLVWSPETAGLAYIDAVRALAEAPDAAILASDGASCEVAELAAAMAGGWRARCIVEALAPGAGPAVSLALSAAARHTGGRHVVLVPDGVARADGEAAVGEVVAGEAGAVMDGIEGVDFAVVDWRREDAGAVLKGARIGPRGAVLMGVEAGGGGGGEGWGTALREGARVVRVAVLPIGKGLEVVHVGVGKGPSLGGGRGRKGWVRHVDRETGEEHLYRR